MIFKVDQKFILSIALVMGGIFILPPSPARAHLAEERPSTSQPATNRQQPTIHQSISAMIVEPDLFPAKTPLPIWFEIKDTATNTHLANLTPKVSLTDPQQAAIDSGAAVLKGDEYVYEYTFPEPGDYKLVLTFSHESQEHQSTFTIPVSASQTASPVPLVIIWWMVGLTAVVIVIIWLVDLVGQPKVWRRSLVLTILTLAVAGIVYSVLYTIRSGAISAGVVTCLDSGGCFWTAHIHAYLPIKICGQEYSLPIEKGQLKGPHTHEERNIAHWHDRLPYDKSSGKITKTDPLLVSSFFQGAEVPLTNASVADKNVGDLCNGQPATLKAFVNGKYTPEIANHVWQDKEVISIFFDERTPREIEVGLKAKPIQFPALGRG